jgi:hypothetical protein
MHCSPSDGAPELPTYFAGPGGLPHAQSFCGLFCFGVVHLYGCRRRVHQRRRFVQHTHFDYTNTGSGVANITVQATDKCKGSDSELQLVDPSGAVSLHFIIKDRTTKAFYIAVPSGQSVNLACNGESGGCSYSLSVP